MNTGVLVLPGEYCQMFAFIGSQVIPGAAHEGSDTDIAMYCKPEQLAAVESFLDGLDAERGGSQDYGGTDGDGMTSFKVEAAGMVWNYLVFDDLDYFWRFVDATSIVRHFKVTDKKERVAIFDLLTDGIRSDGPIKQIEVHYPKLEGPF